MNYNNPGRVSFCPPSLRSPVKGPLLRSAEIKPGWSAARVRGWMSDATRNLRPGIHYEFTVDDATLRNIGQRINLHR